MTKIIRTLLLLAVAGAFSLSPVLASDCEGCPNKKKDEKKEEPKA
jgi:hypothetical protein